MWTPKNGEIYADSIKGTPQPAQRPTDAEQDEDYGYDIPGEYARPDAPAPAIRPDKGIASLDALFDLHGACWGYAERVSKDDAVRAAISATLLIAAQKAGI